MFMVSLPPVPWNGGCLASSRLQQSSLQCRARHPMRTSSKNSSRQQAGSKAGEEFHSAFSDELASYTDIENAASRQGLSLRLETVGPFFQVRVFNSMSKEVLGAAQGLVKLWTCGRILHLDSARLNTASLKAKRPIFGIAFLLGAAAVRHGYDQKCVKAELLAIKDTDTYHSKVKYSFLSLFHSLFFVVFFKMGTHV
ncbi:hypothetical protein GOP47_0009621 [Adiantum capillus-veneris]|uniref:Uncharacterized protein n=1 Tax=Adiantum capillus-veneris TaxID=13818 RepID=A0A9D4UXC7_ADICA|nr:hypothetical protein GOP47_0009621 [Adiantum capillus-veneris]